MVERRHRPPLPYLGVRAPLHSRDGCLPLDYFKDDVDGTGWEDVPSAYLSFGDVYAPERERARTLGLTVATIAGAEHLHMLMDPTAVADSVEQLLETLVQQ